MGTLFLLLGYLVISLVLIALGLINWLQTKRFVEKAQRTTGTVIAFVQRSGRRGPTYSPTVRFKTMDGNQIEFTEPLSTRPPGYEINEQVPVLYDPESPQRARVFKTTWRLYYYALLFGGLGAIFFVIYTVVLILFRTGNF